MVPSDGTKLILGSSCNNVNSNAISSALPDPQMLFSFIPSKFHYDELFLSEISVNQGIIVHRQICFVG